MGKNQDNYIAVAALENLRKPFGIDVLLEIVNKVMTEGIAGFI
jgi:hypothetical protein